MEKNNSIINIKMKKIFTILMGGIVLLSSCSKDDVITPDVPEKPDNRYLVETQQAGITQKSFLVLALALAGYQEYAALPNSNVEALKVIYNTEYKGDKLVASGIFLVSDNYNPDYPTVIYTHGTITENGAPSLTVAARSSKEIMLGMALASAFNCAVLMPDYIGYGESADVAHPYIHAPSLAQASLDLIRAFKEYADTAQQLSFNNNIFITGYSEGGYAAVALQKKIQEEAPADLRIEKVVAGSGPYDNVAMVQECLKQTADLSAKFVSSYLWTLGMYKNDYGYSKEYAAIFSDADNAVLQASGYDLAYSHPEKLEINTNPALLFKQEFIAGVRDSTDTELLRILADNSFTDFAPNDSLLLVYGTADDWVLPTNSINTYDAMSAKGCKVMSYAFDGNHETTLPYFLDILLSRLQMAVNKQ
jgi:dipeptidyl aminopeptidase/acylaminoacyl peptidase